MDAKRDRLQIDAFLSLLLLVRKFMRKLQQLNSLVSMVLPYPTVSSTTLFALFHIATGGNEADKQTLQTYSYSPKSGCGVTG